MPNSKLCHISIQQSPAFLIADRGAPIGFILVSRQPPTGRFRNQQCAFARLDAKRCLEKRRGLNLVSALLWNYRIHERKSDQNSPASIDASDT
ncbi:hypothetical protein OE497_31880, partial [Pseudomonas aeruginosa]|nr:hypothetical protein [Pseudomonas aeruginosa]